MQSYMYKDVLYSIMIIAKYWMLWEFETLSHTCPYFPSVLSSFASFITAFTPPPLPLILPLHLTSRLFILLCLSSFFLQSSAQGNSCTEGTYTFAGQLTHFLSPIPQKKIFCQSLHILNINLCYTTMHPILPPLTFHYCHSAKLFFVSIGQTSTHNLL